MSMKVQSNFKQSSGQTLVETVVGVFVLTIGISTALGLAVSLFTASSSAVKQVVAAGLAREGVEAVFNMRNTNWLKSQLANNCYNYVNPSGNDANCYVDWLSIPGNPAGTYNLLPPGGVGSYILDSVSTSTDAQGYWTFTRQTTNPNYRLYLDAAAASGVFYKTTSAGATPSDYFREIYLETQTSPSYYQASIGPRLKVASRVWWIDKGCPEVSTWSAALPKCRIELVTYLTNWKNY